MTATDPHREPLAQPTPTAAAHAGDAVAASESPPAAQPFWQSDGMASWLSSLVLHTLLLILLMLWQLAPGHRGWELTFSQSDTGATAPAQLEQLLLSQEPQPDASAEDAVDTHTVELSNAAPVPLVEAPHLDLLSDLLINRSDAGIREQLEAQLSSNSAAITGSALLQGLPSGGMAPRTAASRAELGARYGASPESENAVELALAWLAEHQQRDGSWSFDLTVDPCRGRCSHSRAAGDNATPATAATGLALLAFMGAGHTHHEGPYIEQVRRGLYYLREAARPTQTGYDLQAGSMYGHGIATLALTEALAIDRYFGKEDGDLRELAEGAVLFTLVAQHSGGGWRYVPGSPGDMTVSGWQILSLISARHADIKLRTTTLADARAFVMSLSAENAFAFGYTSQRPQPCTTAIGLCMLLYLGQSPGYTPFMHALDGLAARGPSRTDLYHNYYATLALHNARHHAWEEWHIPLRDHLVRTQAQAGHERGSWHFKDVHGDVGGRLYSTAMATLILEVYYRHLPLYQSRDEFELR